MCAVDQDPEGHACGEEVNLTELLSESEQSESGGDGDPVLAPYYSPV